MRERKSGVPPLNYLQTFENTVKQVRQNESYSRHLPQ